MDTTSLNSFTVHHDGDIDGPMIAVQGDIGIIITSNTLLSALKTGGDKTTLFGPVNSEYDRHFITGEPDWNEFIPGPYRTCKITVERVDIERFILLSKSCQIEHLIDELDFDKHPFAETAAVLDNIINSMKKLTDSDDH